MGKNKNRHRRLDKNSQPSENSLSSKGTSLKYRLGVLAVFCLFAFIIYGNSLNSPFIWDDPYLITDNHLVTSFKYIPEIFKHHLYYSTAGVSNFYRPLQLLFLMFDYSIWKTNVFGYHLTSIVFHLLCGFLIFLIIDSVFRRRAVAFLVGLLFLVHPINSTVVDYIASRADSQVTLFVLLSFWLFFKSACQLKQDKGCRIYYFGSMIFFVLALLSKELGVILPFLILINLGIICKEVIPSKQPEYKKVIPFFAMLGIYIFLRLTILNFSTHGLGTSLPLYTRLLTTAESFVRLMGSMFIPTKIHIEKSIPFSSGLFQPSTFISLIFLIGIGVFMYRTRRRFRMTFFGLTWFFVALIPMANIVPINATIADHWLYLPCFGFLLAVVGGISDWLKDASAPEVGFKKIVLGIAVVTVIIFSVLTVRQNTIWADPLKFYRLALEYSPGSYRAHNEIGVIFLNQDIYDKAIPEFKESIRINPRFDQAYDNLGVAYDKSGNLEEAVKQHKKALELSPYNVKIYNNLGNAYIKLNQFEKAIESYKKALELNPDYKAVYNNLGVIYFKRGMYDEARKYWQRALKIDPNFKLVLDNLKVLERAQSR
ncbi:tetratricopeptide repeat protein [Candidatus Omnitrophota bacterium]